MSLEMAQAVPFVWVNLCKEKKGAVEGEGKCVTKHHSIVALTRLPYLELHVVPQFCDLCFSTFERVNRICTSYVQKKSKEAREREIMSFAQKETSLLSFALLHLNVVQCTMYSCIGTCAGSSRHRRRCWSYLLLPYVQR